MVQYDLSQRDQGDEQSRDLSVRQWLARHGWLVVVVVLGLSTLASAALRASQPEQALAQTGPVVLVSGRDDHGLLAEPLVALGRGPGQTRRVAQVPDATIVRVLEARGEWLRVQSLTNPRATGWINDYYLRNRALRTDTGDPVSFVDARWSGDQTLVLVASTGSAASAAWIPAALLREIGAQDDHDHTQHQH